MANNVGNLKVKLNLDSAAYEYGIKQCVNSTKVLGQALGALGVGFSAAKFVDIGRQAIQASSDFEQAGVAFGVMLGDAKKAKRLVNDLQNMANVTPFETQDLLDASKTLLNFGISANEVLPDLQMLGDIAGGDKQRMQSLTLAFSQMSSAGRLMGQDLLQMVNAGFNPLEEIARKTGKSIGYWKDEMSKGNVSVEMVRQAFIDATSEGGRFYKMMDKQSETFEGRLSTLNDAYTLMIRNISDGALPVLKEQIIEVTKLVEKTDANITAFKNWAAVNNQTIVSLQNTGLALASVVAGTTAFIAVWKEIETVQKAATAALLAEKEAQIGVTQASYVLAEAETALNVAIAEKNAALATGTAQEIKDASAKVTLAEASYFQATANQKQALATAASTKATSLQCVMTGNLTKAIKVATAETKAFTLALLRNPFTWLAVAIGGVAAAVMSYKNKIEQTTAAIEDFNNAQNQSIDETENAIKTLEQLNDVLKPTDKQYRELQNAIETLKNKYPAYASEIQNEIRLQGKLSEALAKKIALMETEQQLKKLDAEIDKNYNLSKGFHGWSNIKKSVSFGKIDEQKVANDNVLKLLKEREEVISRYTAKVQTLMSIGREEPTASKTSTSTASTDGKKKKTDKQLAAEAKAAAKEALEYKLALLDVERYQTERTDAEIYQFELEKANLKIASAKKGTSEYAQALADRYKLEQDYAKKVREIELQKIIDKNEDDKQRIANADEILNIEYNANLLSKKKLLESEILHIREKKHLEQEALQAQLALIKGNTAEEVKLKRESNKTIEALDRELLRKQLELENQKRVSFREFSDSVATGWGNTVSGVIKGDIQINQIFNSVLDTMIDSFADYCGKQVALWFQNYELMGTIQSLFGIKKKATDLAILGGNTSIIASQQAVGSSAMLSAIQTETAAGLQVGANKAIGLSSTIAATETATSAGVMTGAAAGIATGISALISPVMSLAGAFATLATSSAVCAITLPIIAISTTIIALSSALAALSLGFMNMSMMLMNASAMVFVPVSLLLTAEFAIIAAAATVAAKAVGMLAVSLAAASAAAIPIVGWVLAPGAALSTAAAIAAGQALIEFREKGGPVKAGQPYIVGEKRPELFIPDRNGTILPDTSALNGGGSSNTIYNTPVTVTVQALDAKSFEGRIDEMTGRIHSNLAKAIKGRKMSPLTK